MLAAIEQRFVAWLAGLLGGLFLSCWLQLQPARNVDSRQEEQLFQVSNNCLLFTLLCAQIMQIIMHDVLLVGWLQLLQSPTKNKEEGEHPPRPRSKGEGTNNSASKKGKQGLLVPGGVDLAFRVGYMHVLVDSNNDNIMTKK